MSVFFKAIQAHTTWKLRLTRYAHGEGEERLDPEVIGCDDQCALGKWIHSNDGLHEDNELFTRLRSEHAEFHKMAAEVVRMVDEGNAKEAEKLLHGEYSNISHKVIKGLTSLRGDIGEQFEE